jgi:hypothetical protein
MAVIEVTRPAFCVQITGTQPSARNIQRLNQMATPGNEVRS